MARGWESKSVEQQQEEMAEQRKSFREKTGSLVSPTLPPKEQQRNRKREGLLLSRGRLTQELQAASHLRHRQMLEQAITELDRQLSSFEQVADTKPRK